MCDSVTTNAGGLLAKIAELLENDSFEAAVKHAETASCESGTEVDGICAMAALYFRAGQIANAITLLAKVVENGDGPKDVPEALAVLYCLVGSMNEALYYGKLSATVEGDGQLLALFGPDFPKFSDAFANVGYKPLMASATTSMTKGNYAHAVELLQQHLTLYPTDVEALGHYAEALGKAGDMAAAIGVLRSVAALAEPTATLLSRLAQCLTAMGEHDQAEACHAAAVVRAPKSLPILGALLADQRYRDPEQPATRRALQQWRDAITAMAPKTVRPAPVFTPGQPIKIAYLCAGSHPLEVLEMLAAMATVHDRKQFTVLALSSGEQDDRSNSWSRGVFDSWRDVGDIDVATLGAYMRGEGVNVLIDVDGLTMPERGGLFLRNSAPLQIAWLNTPPTGRAPGSHLHWSPGAGSAAEGEFAHPFGRRFLGGLSAAAGVATPAPAVAAGTVTFGCEISAAQMNADLAMVFGRVLHAVPDSVLLIRDTGSFADDSCVERLISVFGNAGVAHRIEVVRGVTRTEFAASIDIALAPFPAADLYASADLLRLGVPVVVQDGAQDGADLAAALRAANLAELTAADAAGYVAVAAGLGQDIDALARLRADIPARLAASPAFSAEGYVRALEAAILEALNPVGE